MISPVFRSGVGGVGGADLRGAATAEIDSDTLKTSLYIHYIFAIFHSVNKLNWQSGGVGGATS